MTQNKERQYKVSRDAMDTGGVLDLAGRRAMATTATDRLDRLERRATSAGGV